LTQLRAQRPRDGHHTLRAERRLRFFSQTNDLVATHLSDTIVEQIPANGSFLVDAYCGAGFFTKRLAGNFSRVVGIDWDAYAIAAAQANAIDRESYVVGDVTLRLAEQLDRFESHLTTVIVDPPAAGLTKEVLGILLERPPARLFYVSCNPATLARDLAALRTRFVLESITPFDMFPQTAEIEALAHLTLASPISP
jgi:23S rRNA (uracil1939-C5)-methyltransferase